MKILGIICICFTLIACATTGRVAVFNKQGVAMTGTYTASLGGGYFIVTNGKVTCSGSYDALDMSENITMPVHCSNGVKGFVVSTRKTNPLVDGYYFQSQKHYPVKYLKHIV